MSPVPLTHKFYSVLLIENPREVLFANEIFGEII